MVNKQLVKERFQKKINTYEKNAIVQKQMADFLINNLKAKQSEFERIFEIGCGSGLLTKRIQSELSFKEIFLNDLINCTTDENFIQGDCETIDFPQNLDLIISNAAFQWVEELPALFCKVSSSLNKEGIFAFSTFGKQNFSQIKDITGNSLKYFDKSEVEEMLKDKFKLIYSEEIIQNLGFKTVLDILKHLQKSGVNALSKNQWTKKDLKDFENKYSKYKNDNEEFLLTYHPMFFIATVK